MPNPHRGVGTVLHFCKFNKFYAIQQILAKDICILLLFWKQKGKNGVNLDAKMADNQGLLYVEH